MNKKTLSCILAASVIAVSNCGMIACSDINEPSHKHSYSVAEVIEPTCISDGYSVYKCECGDSYNGDTVAALGHDYTQWTWTDDEHSRECRRGDDVQHGVHTIDGDGCSICGYEPPSIAELELVLSDDGTSYAVSGLKSDGSVVEIPKEYDGIAVTSIEPQAFKDSEIVSVILPEGLEKIGNGAFAGTSKLRSVVIPSTVTVWGTEVFTESGVQSVEINCGSVGASAFYGCEQLKSVVLANSVGTINANAFYACSALDSVVFPQSGVTITGSAFGYTTALEIVEIPAGTKWSGAYAFWHSGVKNVTLHCGVGSGAFECCESLENVMIDLPNNTSATIASQAFKDSGLKTITISDGITSIGQLAFANCKNLKTIVIPDTVKTIGTTTISKSDRGVFMGSGLTEIVIPDSVETLNDQQAFENCKDLKSIHFGKNCNAKVIALYRFSDLLKGCNALETITVSDGHPHYYAENNCLIYKRYSSSVTLDKMGKNVTEIPAGVVRIGRYAFYENTDITTFTIPNNITEIETYAFYGCSNLKTVSLPNTLTTIDSYSFENCGLTEITFPASLKRIQAESFKGCSLLTRAVFSDPESWSVKAVGAGASAGEALVLTDPAVNARYLTVDHCGKAWGQNW